MTTPTVCSLCRGSGNVDDDPCTACDGCGLIDGDEHDAELHDDL